MNKFENHKNYNCEVTLDSGEKYLVFSNWIHNQELDYWQGWHCEAGNTRFYIDKNFDIWSGMCQNDFLGNVLTEWNPVESTLCRQTTCTGCTEDLAAKKHE